MATLEEQRRKRQQEATKAYTGAIQGATIGSDLANAAMQIQENSPFGLPARVASAAVRPVASAIQQNYRRAQGLPPATATAAPAPATPSPFTRLANTLTPPAATPRARAAAPAPTPRMDVSPEASDARIRAIANEGRVSDPRQAPPVVDVGANIRGRAIFGERAPGGRSAFEPDIQGAAAPTGAVFASPQEIQRYRESVAARPAADQEEAYRRALEGTALGSGDTWFDFMQKNQQRAAILSARKNALEQEKLASGERAQERRGAIEAGLQQERLGAEREMQQSRLTAAELEAARQREFDLPFKQTAARGTEADIAYRGALGEEATARGSLARIKAEEAQQEQALRKEYADPKTPQQRRNVIANILQGKQDTSFDTLMGKVLENAQDPNTVITLMSQAKVAANDPSSPYFGDPLSAYSDLAKVYAPQEKQYAMGGAVDAKPYNMGGEVYGYAQGGAVGMQEFGGLPEVDETATLAKLYTQYAQTTQAMGAVPVDFNKFSTLMTTVRDRMAVPMQDPSAMGMPGYAQGGAVDVSGRQVFGPGTETSDSIPAVIDGQTPAALSTNEFVWTANATEAASPAVLKAVMTGLERNDPEIVSGIMALAAKAVKKPAQPAME